MAFLDLAGDDWNIACAIIRKAQEIQRDTRFEEAKLLARAIASELTRILPH